MSSNVADLRTSQTVVTRLAVMMFLQFFVWGAWFATLGQCLGANGLGIFGSGAYGSAPIAAIFAPLFLGIVADRLFSSERVMGILFLLGGVLLCLVPGVAAKGAEYGDLVVWLFIGNMLCYMPTLGLGNTVAFTHITDRNQFPKIRVWGTIGWIVAGLFVGIMGWSASLNMFWVAGISSLVLGLYSFTLPHTPPPAKGKPMDFRAILMLDAFKLLIQPGFLVFMACSTLICIPLAYYYGIIAIYLNETGFVAPAASMTTGQMSEIFFMLLIPFFIRRLGVKWMILVGMLAWVARYALFALAAPDQLIWMIFLGIALHGICFDFFFVTGFMYTDKVASKDIRGQAQSMLVFFTQGVGMYFGYLIAFGHLGGKYFSEGVPGSGPLSESIKTARPATEGSFLDGFKNMFSVDSLESLNVDSALVTETMAQWKDFWFIPAGMAGLIAIIFFLTFWDKMSNHDANDEG